MFCNKGTHQEVVVAVLAFHAQHRFIGVNEERICILSTVHDHGSGIAETHVAPGDSGRTDFIASQNIAGTIAPAGLIKISRVTGVRPKDLADLEHVQSLATVKREDGGGFVHEKHIVTSVPVYGNAAVDCLVIIYPFHRIAVGVDLIVAMQMCDKVAPHQKDIVFICRVTGELTRLGKFTVAYAFEEQCIHTVVGLTAVEDTQNVVAFDSGLIDVTQQYPDCV